MDHRRLAAVATLAAALSLVTVEPVAAGDWTVSLAGAWTSPGGSAYEEADGAEVSRAELDDGYGLAVAVEYRLSPRIGLELAYLHSEIDGTLAVSVAGQEVARDSDSLSVAPLTVGLELHLLADAPLDLTVGVFAGQVFYGDFAFEILGESVSVDVDDDATWGAGLGLDVPFGGGGSALAIGARYFDTDAEEKGGDARIGVDPLVLTVGFSYSF